MRYLAVEELAGLSSDVIRGQIIAVNVYWDANHKRIYTAARVRVRETFKGQTRPDQTITVTQPGGEKDGVRMDYAGRPEFATGEEVALFAVRGDHDDFIVVGLKQGKMRIEKEEVVRDFSGVLLVEGAGDGKRLRPLPLKTVRLTMDEFRTRIARGR
jgi:hypothetical protein